MTHLPLLYQEDPAGVALSFWRIQLQEAARMPRLARKILRRGRVILQRFIHFYQRLQLQPRKVRRFLQAKMAASLIGVSFLLAMNSVPAHAATITVDGTTCILVDAITAANTDMATGGCTAGSGADTLDLGGGTFTLYGPSPLPIISSAIIINGNGATIQADISAPSFPLLEVNSSGDLTLDKVTISNSQGNGIYSYGGSVTVNDSTISGNAIDGINSGFYSTVTINNSTLSDNTGYGVSLGSGSLEINDSIISGNLGIFSISCGGQNSNEFLS